MPAIALIGLLAMLGGTADGAEAPMPVPQVRGRLTVHRPDWCRTVRGAAAQDPHIAPGATADDPPAAPAPARCATGRLTVPRPEVAGDQARPPR